MSGMGLEWYKREPNAYLRDVQGLTEREHAVYSVVLDLIYSHGGAINNDPKWISGWFSNIGSAAVRNTIQSLSEKKYLVIDGQNITQKRAKTEAKRKENSGKTEEKRPEKIPFSGGACNENNGLTPIEKRREDNISPLTPQGGMRKSRFVGVSEEVQKLARAAK